MGENKINYTYRNIQNRSACADRTSYSCFPIRRKLFFPNSWITGTISFVHIQHTSIHLPISLYRNRLLRKCPTGVWRKNERVRVCHTKKPSCKNEYMACSDTNSNSFHNSGMLCIRTTLAPSAREIFAYWLLMKSETSQELLLKLGVFFLNYWIWSIGVLAAIFCIGYIQCLFTVSLRDCIHTFWNVETNSRHIPFAIRATIYRQIQLLANLQTDVQAGSMMTLFLLVVAFAFSINVVLILRFPWTTENTVLIILAIYLICLCVVGALFILGGHANVWIDSRKMFEKLDRLRITKFRRPNGGGDWKLQELFWKSCRNLIKVKFGVNNFVEKDTPLNFMQCIVSLTVQFLLLY